MLIRLGRGLSAIASTLQTAIIISITNEAGDKTLTSEDGLTFIKE